MEDPIANTPTTEQTQSANNGDGEESEASWDVEKDIYVELSKEKQGTIDFKGLAASNTEQFLLYLQAALPIEVSIKNFNAEQSRMMEEKMYISIAGPTFKKVRFYVRPCKSKSGKAIQAYETDDGRKFIEHVFKNILEAPVELPDDDSKISEHIKFMICQQTGKEMLTLFWSKFFKGTLAKSCEPLSPLLNTEQFADRILNTRIEWFPHVYAKDGSMKPEYIEKYKARLHKEISSSISADVVVPPSSSEPTKPKKPKVTKSKEQVTEKKKTTKSSSNEETSSNDLEEPKKPAKKGRKPKAKDDGKLEEETSKTPKKAKKNSPLKGSNDMEITITVPKDDNLQSISQGDIITAVECFSSLVGIKPSRLVPLLCALNQINETMEGK